MSDLNPHHNQENKKRRKKIIFWFFTSFFLVLITFTVLLLAQNDEPNSYVKVNEAYYILNEGESTLVTFEASQDLGAFTYTSNDTSVVQFIENRLITVGTGSTTITISSQSNPSVFQTVSVIVREREIETEAPIEPEVPAELEPEIPVDVEPELPEDPELEVPVNPVDTDDLEDEVFITPPSIYTITITNETGAVITTLQLEEGSFITTSSLELPETFKGFYLEGETCTDDPFDLDTPITENLTLIQASFNDQAPCLQLDYIVLRGRPVAGTTLTVDVFPIGANVTISWYTSVNNRTYREIQGESKTTFTVRPEDSGKFIRVYVVSDSIPPVVRYDTIKLDVFGTVSDSGGGASQSVETALTDQENEAAIELLNQGYIPLAFRADIYAIEKDEPHHFSKLVTGGGDLITNGGLDKSYVLIRNIDFGGITHTKSIVDGIFTGTVSGQGFSISNVEIISPSATGINGRIGLFKTLSSAEITDINLINFNIEGGSYVGALSGELGNSNLNRINVLETTIQGRFAGTIAGIASISRNTLIENISIGAVISYEGTDNGGAGGLFGTISSSQELNIRNILINDDSQFTGVQNTIKSGNVGGLIGNASSNRNYVSIENVTLNGIIGSPSSGKNVGGLIGSFYGTLSAINIHQNAPIAGQVNVGGILGWFRCNTMNLQNIYQNGNVNGQSSVGGLLGSSEYFNNTCSSGVTTSIISMSGITQSGDIIGSGNHVSGVIGLAMGNTSVKQLVMIEDLIQTGKIESETGSRVSGIISLGQYIDISLKNISQTAIIGRNNENVGGFVAYLQDFNNITISGFHQSGQIRGKSYHVGGLFGYVINKSTGSSITLNNITQGAIVLLESNNNSNPAGGIFGIFNSQQPLTISGSQIAVSGYTTYNNFGSISGNRGPNTNFNLTEVNITFDSTTTGINPPLIGFLGTGETETGITLTP